MDLVDMLRELRNSGEKGAHIADLSFAILHEVELNEEDEQLLMFLMLRALPDSEQRAKLLQQRDWSAAEHQLLMAELEDCTERGGAVIAWDITNAIVARKILTVSAALEELHRRVAVAATESIPRLKFAVDPRLYVALSVQAACDPWAERRLYGNELREFVSFSPRAVIGAQILTHTYSLHELSQIVSGGIGHAYALAHAAFHCLANSQRLPPRPIELLGSF